jgi:hypothetical protein
MLSPLYPSPTIILALRPEQMRSPTAKPKTRQGKQRRRNDRRRNERNGKNANGDRPLQMAQYPCNSPPTQKMTKLDHQQTAQPARRLKAILQQIRFGYTADAVNYEKHQSSKESLMRFPLLHRL